MAALENDEVARILSEIADQLEVAGDNFFRMRASRGRARWQI
jgi:DNA polymerase/3'-5' exonuclease PolX